MDRNRIIDVVLQVIDTHIEKESVIRSQKYEKAAQLRDKEKVLISKLGVLISERPNIDFSDSLSIVNEYLSREYEVSLYDGNAGIVLKRHLKLEEVLKKD